VVRRPSFPNVCLCAPELFQKARKPALVRVAACKFRFFCSGAVQLMIESRVVYMWYVADSKHSILKAENPSIRNICDVSFMEEMRLIEASICNTIKCSHFLMMKAFHLKGS
jgi:hypothetical protein